jgi:segregation and condensation protein B
LLIQLKEHYSMSNEPLSESSSDLIIARIEALLFVAAGPTSPSQISQSLDIPLRVIENHIAIIEQRLATESQPHGLRLQRHHGRVQLTTSPDFASDVERFLGLEISSKLSRAALVTRPEIDAVRGVSSDGVLKNLLSKGLVQEIGRAERPGRPILFTTTSDFLQHFGLNSLEELPQLSLDLFSPTSSIINPEN